MRDEFGLITTALIAVMLTACTTTPKAKLPPKLVLTLPTDLETAPEPDVTQDRAPVTAPAAVTPPEPSATNPKGLSPRVLMPKDCGLFVWSGDPSRRFILFSQSQKERAVWEGENDETALHIDYQSGALSDKQQPRQSLINLQNPDVMLELNLSRKETTVNGTRYKGGNLTIKRAGQWDKVMPVIGLSTCKR